MTHEKEFLVNGRWHSSAGNINPATEQFCAQVAVGEEVDIDRAVDAAKAAFPAYSAAIVAERIDLLQAILERFERNIEPLAHAMSMEMRAGNIQTHCPPVDRGAPFGDYKKLGNGREWGLNEYPEINGVIGYHAE
jgi:aldehyde dehydrogenase (NAD+)